MPVQRAKLAFRGRDRKRIKSLLNYLNQVSRMDTARANAATVAGVPAILYKINGATNVTGAITQLVNRCTAAIAQKVSQQALPAGDNPV